MKILITGASGFLGQKLAESLLKNKNSLVFVSRNADKTKQKLSLKGDYYSWDYKKEEFPQKALKGVDSVIHLMGEGIASGRWNNKRKEEIYNSRILTTRKIVKALPASVKSFLCSSAVGIYSHSFKQKYTEETSFNYNGTFLQKTCIDWEEEALNAKKSSRRVVLLRTGLVLGQAGFLAKMLPVFKAGLGGCIAGGKAYMSCIHADDWVSAVEFCIQNKKIHGPVNMVSEHPVTNQEFTKTLAKAVRRPAFFHIPGFVIKILLGEASRLALDSQYVIPEKLKKNGFLFKFNNINEALRNLVA